MKNKCIAWHSELNVSHTIIIVVIVPTQFIKYIKFVSKDTVNNILCAA